MAAFLFLIRRAWRCPPVLRGSSKQGSLEEIPSSKHNHSSETWAPALLQHLMVCQTALDKQNLTDGTLCVAWRKISLNEGRICSVEPEQNVTVANEWGNFRKKTCERWHYCKIKNQAPGISSFSFWDWEKWWAVVKVILGLLCRGFSWLSSLS